MISGLRLRVTSAELKLHCQFRAQYHKARAEEKRDQLSKMRPLVEALKTDPLAAVQFSNIQKNNYRANPEDTLDALEEDIREHHNKYLLFVFYSEHLFEEDYDLKDDDLIRLEMLKR